MKLFFTVLTGCIFSLFFWGLHPATACLVEKADYGDAPDSYATLGSSFGAAHVATGLFLGENVDEEPDGQPYITAALDLWDDGVVFETPLVIGERASILVNASGNGILSAWMDFNFDGDWSDRGERIFYNTALSYGETRLFFDIPLTSEIGDTYARFRFSTERDLNYYGLSFDGEVEDYKVEIVNSVPVPNAMILLGSGLIGLAGIVRKKRNS